MYAQHVIFYLALLSLYSTIVCIAMLQHSSSCKLLAVPCSKAKYTFIFANPSMMIIKNSLKGLVYLYIYISLQKSKENKFLTLRVSLFSLLNLYSSAILMGFF